MLEMIEAGFLQDGYISIIGLGDSEVYWVLD